MIYKYDLPLENRPIEFRKDQLTVVEESKATPLMRLLEQLSIDKDSSFESYALKVGMHFNNEVDMYGDVRKAGDT